MTRVTTRVLSVRETLLSDSAVFLPPGTVLTECEVVCHHAGEECEPYQVHFSTEGREYVCPLYAFQPRTECWTEEMEQTALQRTALAM